MEREPIVLTHITTVPQTLDFLRGQIGYLRERGYEIHAVSSPGTELDAIGGREGIAVHGVPMERRITPVRDLVALARMVRVLGRVRPTIVHAHTPKGGVLGMVAASVARTPARVYTVHGLPYMTASGWRRWLLKVTERVSATLAHQVLCVSPSIREVAIRDGICAPAKIGVIGRGSVNGLDAEGVFNPERFDAADRGALREKLGIPMRAPVLGFVGRVVRDKGVHELARAWEGVRESFPDAHLVIVGERETEDAVAPEVVGTLRDDPHVHLTGGVDDTAAYYAVFDVLVLPTHREGFGTVNLEAAAMALPVVSTDIPGVRDSVDDGRTGMLVAPGNAGALRDALVRYLGDPELRRSHGRAGRERVLRDFRQPDIWRDTLQCYQEVLRLRGNEGRKQGAGASAAASASIGTLSYPGVDAEAGTYRRKDGV